MPRSHPLRRGSPARLSLRAALFPGAALALFMAGCDASRDEVPSFDSYPELQVQQEVAIGHPDHPDYAFTQVTGMAVAPDGTIWTLHRVEAVLRRWSAEGEPLGVVGRRGEGPGEFVQPTAMGTVGEGVGDSLWVHDMGTSRFTFLRWGGEVGAMEPAPVDLGTREGALAGDYPARPMGLLADGSVHAFPPAFSSEVLSGLITRTPHLRWSGSTEDTLFVAPVRQTDVLGVEQETGGVFTQQPYQDGALTLRTPGGEALVLVEREAAEAPGPASFQVTWVAAVPGSDGTAPGDTLRQVEVAYPAVALPRSEVDFRVEEIAERLHAAVGERMGMTEGAVRRGIAQGIHAPPTRPAVRGVLVGRDGSLWISLREAPGPEGPLTEEEERGRPVRHMILDPAGEVVGTVVLPARVRPLLVEVDRFWGVETDETEVEYVVRYRVGD